MLPKTVFFCTVTLVFSACDFVLSDVHLFRGDRDRYKFDRTKNRSQNSIVSIIITSYFKEELQWSYSVHPSSLI